MTTKRRRRKAIVIGCGIGGPAVALALGRAGIDTQLCEGREWGPDAQGSFLNLASNGLDALRTLDAHQPVLEGARPTSRMVMWSYTGKRLGEVANGVTLADGTRSVTVMRSRLHRSLREEAERRGATIAWGKRLSSAESTKDGVVARFADGTSVEGDLLVGADGIHSRTRRLIDPNSPSSRYTGQLSIGGVARSPRFEPTPDAYQMVFGRRAFFGFTVGPEGEAWWFANLAAPAEDASLPPAECKRRLLGLFEDDAGPASEMIAATDADFGVYAVHDMPPVPVWHRGPSVLIGDAIHATSPSAGQGASMAIEDAVVLGKCLQGASELEDAFREYERLRRGRVEKVVTASRRVGNSKVAGPVGRVMRDLLMPTALKLYSGSATHDWLYRYHIDWTESEVRS